MNLMPLLGFYERQHAEIAFLFKGSGSSDGSSLALDIVNAIAPVIKKHFPVYNSNRLLDDAVETLNKVMAPDPPAQS